MTNYEARQMKQVAYVIGMAIGCLCDLEGMKQFNRERAARGEAPGYSEEAFKDLYREWGMNHNALVLNLEV